MGEKERKEERKTAADLRPEEVKGLIRLAIEMCEMVEFCAPRFAAGSRGEKTVDTARTARGELAKLLSAVFALGLAATLRAAVPVAWTNSPGMSPRMLPPVPHGSTVDFAVTLRGYTTPPVADGADVRMWFQTNGMGSAWWSAPATMESNTITAVFGPAQDTGAERVSVFFGAPSNVFAAAVLRFSHAPGFRPNVLELPRAALDFSQVDVTNAPWVEEEADPTVPAWAKAENPPQTDISGKAESVKVVEPADYWTDGNGAILHKTRDNKWGPPEGSSYPFLLFQRLSFEGYYTDSWEYEYNYMTNGEYAVSRSEARPDYTGNETNIVIRDVYNHEWMTLVRTRIMGETNRYPVVYSDSLNAVATAASNNVSIASNVLASAIVNVSGNIPDVTLLSYAEWHPVGEWPSDVTFKGVIFGGDCWDLSYDADEYEGSVYVAWISGTGNESTLGFTIEYFGGPKDGQEVGVWVAKGETAGYCFGNQPSKVLAAKGYVDNVSASLSSRLAQASQASTNYADAATALVPVYSQNPTFSEWVITGYPTGWSGAITGPVATEDDRWQYYVSGDGVSEFLGQFSSEAEALLAVQLYIDDTHAATRPRTDIIGYALGTQTAKPLQPAGDYATTAAVSGKADASQVNLIGAQVNAIGATLNAEDARFVVTNYDSAVHTPEAYVEVQLSNSWLVVWREGTRWRAYETFRTNVLDELSHKADRAWGAYDSETGGWSPDGFTQISSSNVLVAAGMSYQRTVTGSGAVWVLRCNHGVATLSGGQRGFLVADGDGAAQLEVVKGNRLEMGADADGITVDNSTSPPTVTIPYSIVAEEHPTLRITGDLAAPDWKNEDDADCIANVSWSGTSGAWVATVQRKTAGCKMFVKATYFAGGETYIRAAAPMKAEGGIFCTDGVHKIRPVYSNGSVTWEVVQ